MAKSMILVRIDNNRIVFNNEYGWVDRDLQPGATYFSPEQAESIVVPVDAHWEEVDG